MQRQALHFGAGALGRGLVVPSLVEAGVPVAVADTDIALVDRIRAAGGYPLIAHGPSGVERRQVPVARAFALGRDDAALDGWLAGADFVTTAVRLDNLPRVVARLAGVWSGAGAARRAVIGCENLRGVGARLAGLFAAEGLDPTAAGLVLPDCVVDRICAPGADGLSVETETYREWAAGPELPPDFAGPARVAEIDRLFLRKRYLVNALADAAAFLGAAEGHAMLHQAMRDEEILARIEPLLALLRAHLARCHGFSPPDLADYQAVSIARLGNAGIPRRIDTVARDPWRKLAPDERFMQPLAEERAAGRDIGPALAVIAGIVAAVEPDRGAAAARLAGIWDGTPLAPLLPEVLR